MKNNKIIIGILVGIAIIGVVGFFFLREPDPISIIITPEIEKIVVEETKQFAATVYPPEAKQEVVWSVDDEAIGTITTDGMFTAVRLGVVIVTATSVVDEAILDTITITITISIEQANLILTENIQNTLGLDSFITIGDASFQIKDGETAILGVMMRDVEMSTINSFDFDNQELNIVGTYNVMINFEVIADLIKAGMSSEELDEIKAGMMGMDPLEAMRGIGKANISVTMENKLIDFDSYMKIVEVAGLEKIPMVGVMVMAGIEPYLGVWHKTPADPEMIQEMTVMFEKIEELILSLFDIYYVKEVLSNTEVEGVLVYNFALGIDLEKLKDVVISFIPLVAEKAEMEINEKKIKIGIIVAWPKVIEVVGAMEMDSRIYICQATRFTIKETGTINMNLYELTTILEPIITAEMTQEGIIKFERIKEVLKDINFVATMDFVYSDHNTVPAIMPPTEYQVME